MTRGIILTGNPGSGKSSVGQAIADKLGWQRLSFAKPLKDEVAYALAITQRGLPSTKMYEKIRAEMDDPEVKDRYRNILQWWGTEWRRTDDPDYWMRVVQNTLHSNPDTQYTIDDCRFNNERDMLVSEGFVLVRLSDGPTTRIINKHSSEIDWNTWEPDFTFEYEEGVKYQAQRIIDELRLVGAI